MPDQIVEPLPGVAPAPEAAAGPELPDEILQIPAFQAITAGQPGAFSAILKKFEKDPAAQVIIKNKDALMAAGFGFYRSLDGEKGVIFNQLFLAPEEVQAADKAGTLQEIAPPFSELNAAVAKSGAENPVLTAGERPEGFKMGGGGGAAALQPGGIPPLPASAQKTLATKRANNLQPGAPTSGPQPGNGRLLNAILKPVI